MAKRATSTSFGAEHGNDPRKGDKRKAGQKSGDVRLIRKRYREAAARRLQVLCDIADGEITVVRPFGKDATLIPCEPDFGDRIRAVDTLARYGIGVKQDVTSDEEKLTPTQTIIIGGQEVKF